LLMIQLNVKNPK